MNNDLTAPVRESSSRESSLGFSVVEVMIAAAILLLVTIGVLPLFTRSITNNIQGQMSSEAVNQARSELERLLQLNFNDPELTLPVGQTELVATRYWVESDHEWKSETEYTPTDNDTVRIVTVRQFGFGALRNEPGANYGRLEDSEALVGVAPGAPAATAIHFKEIVVAVTIKSRMDAPAKRLTLRAFRGA